MFKMCWICSSRIREQSDQREYLIYVHPQYFYYITFLWQAPAKVVVAFCPYLEASYHPMLKLYSYKYLSNYLHREYASVMHIKCMFPFVLEFKNSCYSCSYWEGIVYYFFCIPFHSFEWARIRGFFWNLRPSSVWGFVRIVHGAVILSMLYCDLLFYLWNMEWCFLFVFGLKNPHKVILYFLWSYLMFVLEPSPLGVNWKFRQLIWAVLELHCSHLLTLMISFKKKILISRGLRDRVDSIFYLKILHLLWTGIAMSILKLIGPKTVERWIHWEYGILV